MSDSAPVLTTNQLADSYSYPAFRQHIAEALAQPAPDPKQAKLLPYYQEAADRLDRIGPAVALLPELQAAVSQLAQPYIWAIITEGWCGDGSETVPIIEAVAQVSGGHLETRYFLRDANLDLMDRYLTNGGRAMPIAVVLHADSLAEAGVWGPRPTPLQALVRDLKAREVPGKEVTAQVHAWYAQDATLTTQRELLALVQRLR